jgi:hypothetical protein
VLLNKSILFAAVFLPISVSGAVADLTFKYISAGNAKRMVTTSGSNVIADGDAFRMSLQVRDQSSHVEKHMTWNEEIIIQEGDVMLNYGNNASNAKEISPGEFNGTSIVGGSRVMMHPGDIVIIPAGTWHEEVIQNPVMRYILFKTKK